MRYQYHIHSLALKTHTSLSIPHLELGYPIPNHKHRRSRSRTVALSSPSCSASSSYKVEFKTLEGCKLGIARYPDFEYNAQGGIGTGEGKVVHEQQQGEEEEEEFLILVDFDLEGLYIPPLSSATTKFLGLSLPPLLKIEIVPESFRGRINMLSGKVDLEFKAKFLFSIGTTYRAPPLLVATTLTSEESIGEMRSGKGQRLDNAGKCKLVGVATVNPINDLFMNTFLGLPTECLADLNATISLAPNRPSLS